MTPAEHFLEAERCLAAADRALTGGDLDWFSHHVCLAQVHAVLATAPRPPRYRATDPSHDPSHDTDTDQLPPAYRAGPAPLP